MPPGGPRRGETPEVPPLDDGGAARAAAGALVAAGLLLWSVAFLQVWHDSPGDWQVLLWRVLHLSGFAAWFGGAVWNVEVAVRAAREKLSVTVVIMANAQLERFRRIVRIALPMIVATGLLQVWDDMGLTRWAVEGPFGHLVLVKLGLIALAGTRGRAARRSDIGAEDQAVIAKVTAHHAEMSARLERLTAAVAQPGDAALLTSPLSSLVEYLGREVLPHAAAEEETIYAEARETVGGAALVDALVMEHQDLRSRAQVLAEIADQGVAPIPGDGHPAGAADLAIRHGLDGAPWPAACSLGRRPDSPWRGPAGTDRRVGRVVMEPLTLDVREDLRAGREPFAKIMQAVGRLAPGQAMPPPPPRRSPRRIRGPKPRG